MKGLFAMVSNITDINREKIKKDCGQAGELKVHDGLSHRE